MVQNIAIILFAALAVVASFLYFRHQAKSPIRYQFDLRKQVMHDFVDIKGYILKGWTVERAVAEIQGAYDIAGLIYEKVTEESEKREKEKRKKTPSEIRKV